MMSFTFMSKCMVSNRQTDHVEIHSHTPDFVLYRSRYLLFGEVQTERDVMNRIR